MGMIGVLEITLIVPTLRVGMITLIVPTLRVGMPLRTLRVRT